MKKLLCVFLCMLFTAFALVSCGETIIGEQLEEYKEKYPHVNQAIPEVSLNLYIVVEDETWQGLETSASADGAGTSNKLGVITPAINTVNNAIKDFTSTNFHSEVNVIYVKESEYETTVMAAVNAESTDASAANIVLVNSFSLMQDLFATGKLCSVDAYLNTNTYGMLNTTIPSSLFDASKMIDPKTNQPMLYTVPNNHVIGNYEYFLVKKSAVSLFNVNESKILSYKSFEDAAELVDAIEATSYSVSDFIDVTSGAYEDKAMYEAAGYYCNVISAPIADANEAFSSAFAIVNRSELLNERAMEIIYNINLNVELRNLLQYGVAGSNYTKDIDAPVERNQETNRYFMNINYTGNIFNAYYCEEIGWTPEAAVNATAQNEASSANQ